MATNTLQRNIFQRIFGICATRPPVNENCWTFSRGKLTIELERVPELSQPWGAIRIESANLPSRVMVMRDGQGIYRAFRNHCEHDGRRLDPVPGTQTVQCCSIGQSVYNYEGKIINGAADKAIKVFPTQLSNRKLIINLPGMNGNQA